MREATRTLLLAAITSVIACSPATRPGPFVVPPVSPTGSTPRAPAPAPAPPAPVTFLRDDVPAAMARARAEGKAVFVDAWAPWCHTCLSMQAYVLEDPSLAPLAAQVVFVAIDTDRPENAPFLERHALRSWPTFFLIDPDGERLLGYWPGAASLDELRRFVAEGLRGLGKRGQGDRGALVEAHAAFSAREYARAAGLYEEAAKRAGEGGGETTRSEALIGWIRAASALEDWPLCARIAGHIDEIEGAALPADFASYALGCVGKFPPGPHVSALRERVIARLSRITARASAGASADDRADAFAIVADALRAAGRGDEARVADEARVMMLEVAAAAAPDVEAAAAYDYGRAGAYLALGRPERAVAMLEERERQMPASYEPPARLAQVLQRAGRLAEARAAIDRAISRSYGPRRLGYLKLRAELLGQLGDREAQIATLRDEVRGHEALARGHASEARLVDAKRRLDEAEKRATTK